MKKPQISSTPYQQLMARWAFSIGQVLRRPARGRDTDVLAAIQGPRQTYKTLSSGSSYEKTTDALVQRDSTSH